MPGSEVVAEIINGSYMVLGAQNRTDRNRPPAAPMPCGIFFLGQSKPRRNHMGNSISNDASRERAAWNAGKKVGTKRPFTLNSP